MALNICDRSSHLRPQKSQDHKPQNGKTCIESKNDGQFFDMAVQTYAPYSIFVLWQLKLIDIAVLFEKLHRLKQENGRQNKWAG